jgi:hypothetical protein
MEFAYTARATFDSSHGSGWTKYIEWSKLIQVEELISLDSSLCETIFREDFEDAEIWNNRFELNSEYFASIYKSIDYILSKTHDKTKYNLLAVVFDPTEECENLKLDHFEFIGYDLIDQDHSTSALTNCGGFEETFKNSELNKNGIIDKYSKALEIKNNLLKNNEDEYHADTNIWAIWRHKELGREK